MSSEHFGPWSGKLANNGNASSLKFDGTKQGGPDSKPISQGVNRRQPLIGSSPALGRLFIGLAEGHRSRTQIGRFQRGPVCSRHYNRGSAYEKKGECPLGSLRFCLAKQMLRLSRECLDRHGQIFSSYAMDRKMLKRHLAQAKTHVETGRKNIARQRKVIAKLENGGRDTKEARTILAQFDELQAMHIADLERILRELAQ
jgi:hypothetical protein